MFPVPDTASSSMETDQKQLTWGVLSSVEFETGTYFNNNNDNNGGDHRRRRRRRRRCVLQAMDVFKNFAKLPVIVLWDGFNSECAVLPRRSELICYLKGLQKGSILEIRRYGFNDKGTIVLEEIEILQAQSHILYNSDPNEDLGDDTVHNYSADDLQRRNSTSNHLEPLHFGCSGLANCRDAYDEQMARAARPCNLCYCIAYWQQQYHNKALFHGSYNPWYYPYAWTPEAAAAEAGENNLFQPMHYGCSVYHPHRSHMAPAQDHGVGESTWGRAEGSDVAESFE